MNNFRLLFLLFLFIGCQSSDAGNTSSNQQTTLENPQTPPPTKPKVDPKDILEYYLALPIDFFSYSICGQEDSKAAREGAIKKKNVKNGYIAFKEECTDAPNEIVLFKDRKNNMDVIALTKYHGDMSQTFYLLSYKKGEWRRIKDTHFPEDDAITKHIETQHDQYKPAVKQAIKSAKEMDDLIPVEFLLPEIGYDVKVIINRELTSEPVELATIKWTGSTFELQ